MVLVVGVINWSLWLHHTVDFQVRANLSWKKSIVLATQLEYLSFHMPFDSMLIWGIYDFRSLRQRTWCPMKKFTNFTWKSPPICVKSNLHLWEFAQGHNFAWFCHNWTLAVLYYLMCRNSQVFTSQCTYMWQK